VVGAAVTRRAVGRKVTGDVRADIMASPSGKGATVVIRSLQKKKWIYRRGTTLALAWSAESIWSAEVATTSGFDGR